MPGRLNGERILIVEDDEAVRRLVEMILTRNNYKAVVAATGEEALQKAASTKLHLVILDLTLPGISGLDVCRQLRSWLTVPILILSGCHEQDQKIEAFDLGADDYVTKPFFVGELLARIRALLRRAADDRGLLPILSAGDLEIDCARRRVRRGGVEIRLTRTEFDILACLARHADTVVTAKMLSRDVLGLNWSDSVDTIRVHVGHIRRKIEPQPSSPRYVLTEPGVGYRLSMT